MTCSVVPSQDHTCATSPAAQFAPTGSFLGTAATRVVKVPEDAEGHGALRSPHGRGFYGQATAAEPHVTKRRLQWCKAAWQSNG